MILGPKIMRRWQTRVVAAGNSPHQGMASVPSKSNTFASPPTSNGKSSLICFAPHRTFPAVAADFTWNELIGFVSAGGNRWEPSASGPGWRREGRFWADPGAGNFWFLDLVWLR